MVRLNKLPYGGRYRYANMWAYNDFLYVFSIINRRKKCVYAPTFSLYRLLCKIILNGSFYVSHNIFNY